METVMASRRRNSGAITISGYQHDAKMSTPHRAAHYLDWAAQHYPKQYTPYNVLLKAIQGFSRMPQLKSAEVEQLRGCMQRVKYVLLTRYGREMDAQPGIGVRATVDSADALTVALPKKMRRLRSAKNAVIQTTDLIDPSTLPNTAEMKPWKEWFNRSVKDVRKMLSSAEFEQKLLPPSSEPED